MSLILDALSKSERERRLGQTPGLYAPMPSGDATRERRRSWPWLVLVAVLAAALAWLLHDRITTPSAGTREAAAPPPALPTDIAPVAPAVEPALAPPSTLTPSAEPRIASPAPPPPSEPQAAAPTAPAPAAPAPAPATTSTATGATTAAPVAASEPATADDGGAVPDGSTPVPVWSLPAAVRARLPPLEVSMHVYHAEPARRFLVVDGRRAEEGTRLAPTVVLVEIRRDGSLLDIDGRPALLPRP